MNTTLPFLTRAVTLFAVSFLVSGIAIAGCGRSDLLPIPGEQGDAEPDVFPEGGSDVLPPPIDAPFDVMLVEGGPPPSCGDHACDNGETCSSCPEDCGSCPSCGDGRCDDGETCQSCAQDCGPCPNCGDHVCSAPGETCFSCPEDCGTCPGCGDGICAANETCASCQTDCGPCSVCGNGTCEAPYETCGDCPEDCGACTNTCLGVIKCTAGCTDPATTVACILACGGSGGCAAADFRIDNLLDCAITNLAACGGFSLSCIEQECMSEIAQCVNNTCDAGM